MLDNEHVFAIQQTPSSKQYHFILFKLDWENGSFQLKYELSDTPFAWLYHLPILRDDDCLLVILDDGVTIKYLCFKFKLKNVYEINKYREILRPWFELANFGLFEDKLLWFEHSDAPEENITKKLRCFDLKTEKLDRFDLKLPDVLNQVEFVVSINIIDA